MWIGGSENLKPGDTIVKWAPSSGEIGAPTLLVERLDPDTVRVVLNEVVDAGQGSRLVREAAERVASQHRIIEEWADGPRGVDR
jgi:hypothetical protein